MTQILSSRRILLSRFSVGVCAGLCAMALPQWAFAAPDPVSFFRAVDADHGKSVAEQLRDGMDPNALDEKGQVALYRAMRSESYLSAQALLDHPQIKVDAANAVGETPLMMAALRGSAAWCQRLIDKGAKVNREGWTPLHYAASGPSTEALQLLLERGADPEALSPNKTTPLMMAARFGSEDHIKALLKRGALLTPRNERDMTAADFARSAGRESLAAQLEVRPR